MLDVKIRCLCLKYVKIVLEKRTVHFYDTIHIIQFD